MVKKISWLLAALIAGVIFSTITPAKLESKGEEISGTGKPEIRVTSAEIVDETDNSLRVRYYLRNLVDATEISACGDVNYATDGYSWGCAPVIVPAYAGHVEITYTMARIARSIECSDTVSIFLYLGRSHHFYQHTFAYEKVWHKNPGEESRRTYTARGCEPPRPVSELLHL